MFIYLIKECKVKVYDVRTKNSIRRVEKKYILSIIIWIVFGMLFTLALGLQCPYCINKHQSVAPTK